MLTLEDTKGMLVEDYSDQDDMGFTLLSYVNLKQETIVEEIGDNLAAQVYEIRRRNGNNTAIRVYK